MGHEFDSSSEEVILKPGDGPEKMRTAIQRAIDDGHEGEDGTMIRIPIENDLLFLGTGEWHFTDEGEMIRASELASRMFSDATGKEVVINGAGSIKNKDSGEREAVLLGIVREE